MALSKKTIRMTAQERKTSIIEAALPLFAEKGFLGVTTKDIASASGVSEALLYKHFDSKEMIYKDIQEVCCTNDQNSLKAMDSLPASTSSLVIAIYFLISSITLGDEDNISKQNIFKKLMIQSLIDDGKFAQIFLESRTAAWLPFFERFLQAAEKNGDLVKTPARQKNTIWFCHHLGVMLSLVFSSGCQVINYEENLENLTDQIAWFSLRGMGLKDEAIEKYYKPKAFKIIKKNN